MKFEKKEDLSACLINFELENNNNNKCRLYSIIDSLNKGGLMIRVFMKVFGLRQRFPCSIFFGSLLSSAAPSNSNIWLPC